MVLFCIFLFLVAIKLVFKLTTYVYDGGECLVGKTAIITGGNRGIGYATAKALASRGCRVIIACRSNADNVRREMIQETHNDNIIVKHIDLLSFESVRNFAKDIHKTEEKIDILINNAGIGMELGATADGLNPTLQCNLFSPFLLTYLLADLLKKSSDGRIIFTSSCLAFLSNLNLDTLSMGPETRKLEKSCLEYIRIYGKTKLGQVILSNGINQRLRRYGIKSNAVHPGFIGTGLWQDFEKKSPLTVFDLILKWCCYLSVFFYSRTPFEGAQGLLALAASNRYKDTGGSFLWGFGMADYYPYPRCLKDKKFCNEIYKKVESIVKLKPEEMLN